MQADGIIKPMIAVEVYLFDGVPLPIGEGET
jgi:hypothetical protein